MNSLRALALFNHSLRLKMLVEFFFKHRILVTVPMFVGILVCSFYCAQKTLINGFFPMAPGLKIDLLIQVVILIGVFAYFQIFQGIWLALSRSLIKMIDRDVCVTGNSNTG